MPGLVGTEVLGRSACLGTALECRRRVPTLSDVSAVIYEAVVPIEAAVPCGKRKALVAERTLVAHLERCDLRSQLPRTNAEWVFTRCQLAIGDEITPVEGGTFAAPNPGVRACP
jgi:hypothetical protein